MSTTLGTFKCKLGIHDWEIYEVWDYKYKHIQRKRSFFNRKGGSKRGRWTLKRKIHKVEMCTRCGKVKKRKKK